MMIKNNRIKIELYFNNQLQYINDIKDIILLNF